MEAEPGGSPAETIAFVVGALRARGHVVDADTTDRIAQILAGDLTAEQARAEMAAKYRQR